MVAVASDLRNGQRKVIAFEVKPSNTRTAPPIPGTYEGDLTLIFNAMPDAA
jgi:hypothetical protein